MMREPKRVAFAASHGLMNLRLASEVDLKIRSLPENSHVLLRRGRATSPGVFESVVAQIATLHGHTVDWVYPNEGGRSSVFHRDYALVENSDYVEAYFDSDHVMEGGTGHVVEAAIASGTSVYAWSVYPDGRIERVGDFEPEDD